MRILIILILTIIVAFGLWETAVFAINNTTCVKSGKIMQCKISDPFNPN